MAHCSQGTRGREIRAYLIRIPDLPRFPSSSHGAQTRQCIALIVFCWGFPGASLEGMSWSGGRAGLYGGGWADACDRACIAEAASMRACMLWVMAGVACLAGFVAIACIRNLARREVADIGG